MITVLGIVLMATVLVWGMCAAEHNTFGSLELFSRVSLGLAVGALACALSVHCFSPFERTDTGCWSLVATIISALFVLLLLLATCRAIPYEVPAYATLLALVFR